MKGLYTLKVALIEKKYDLTDSHSQREFKRTWYNWLGWWREVKMSTKFWMRENRDIVTEKLGRHILKETE